jgi:hypothetical protein
LSAVRRERLTKTGIVAASAAGHLVVFALIGLTVPEVRERFVADEEQALMVDLFRPPPPPRAPRQEAAAAAVRSPSPVRPRLAPVTARPSVLPLPMAPVPRPAAPAAPARTGGGSGQGSDPGAGQPGGDLRGALRRSTVGCANREAVGLTRRENEACDERLGAGAKDAPYIPAPMAGAKRERFDARAAKKERDRKWREEGMPVGTQGADFGRPAGLGNNEEGSWKPK